MVMSQILVWSVIVVASLRKIIDGEGDERKLRDKYSKFTMKTCLFLQELEHKQMLRL